MLLLLAAGRHSQGALFTATHRTGESRRGGGGECEEREEGGERGDLSWVAACALGTDVSG